MKNYLLLLIIGVFFLNCSSDDDNSIKSELIGNWNWIESSGGILGRTETPESTGKIIKLEISSKSVKRFVNGILDSELNYTIESKNFNGEQRDVISYEDNPITQIIILNEPFLTLFDTCNDCFQHEYVRE